jgi:DNA repair protein RadC
MRGASGRQGPPVGFVPEDDEVEVTTLPRSAIERPRERMFAFGPAALSNVELVALLLGGGRSEQRALTLLQQVGGIGGCCAACRASCSRRRGSARRRRRRCAPRSSWRGGSGRSRCPFESPIQGPEDVRRYVRASLRGRAQEIFMVLGLDGRQRVRLVREVAIGSLCHVEVHPREVFRPLVRAGSHSVILVHNHPSGELRPSPSDLRITRRLVELGELLGIPVLDHLIVTDEGMTSFVGMGLLPVPKPAPEEAE